MENIKWGCIQPLTGGMYIGAKQALGCDAAWVISYPGLAAPKYNKAGELVSAGNEYNLLKWLEKHDCIPPYKVFDRKPFDPVPTSLEDFKIVDDPMWSDPNVALNFKDTDIVISVPVCSGLSQATIASDETKDKRNCNMLANAHFALGVVKPKAYIFENAPTLYSDKGTHVREMLNGIAEQYGYSIVYYKTDTQLHNNCQRRPRTFVIFFRQDICENAPHMNYCAIRRSIADYLSEIPEDATQQVTVTMNPENQAYYDFIKHHYGPNWRQACKAWMLTNFIEDNLFKEFYKFVEDGPYSKECCMRVKKIFGHIHDKVTAGMNYYAILPSQIATETIAAAMFKSIPTIIHPTEDRLLTIREWLHLMGHPHDFEMYGNLDAEYPKIGQNVPVGTAKFIVENVKHIIGGDFVPTDSSVAMFDNIEAARKKEKETSKHTKSTVTMKSE